jgi:single-strand DNA-binding protein
MIEWLRQFTVRQTKTGFYHGELDRPKLMNIKSLTFAENKITTEKTRKMSFNKIIIVGNLGRDPELRYTPQGSAVCDFSMATNEKKRDKSGELQDVTTWFKITLWGKQAENGAKYLTKGSPVYIEGRLRVEEWTDRDGNNRYTLTVHGTDMQFISGGARMEDHGEPSESDFAPPEKASQASASSPAGQDDDIPF